MFKKAVGTPNKNSWLPSKRNHCVVFFWGGHPSLCFFQKILVNQQFSIVLFQSYFAPTPSQFAGQDGCVLEKEFKKVFGGGKFQNLSRHFFLRNWGLRTLEVKCAKCGAEGVKDSSSRGYNAGMHRMTRKMVGEMPERGHFFKFLLVFGVVDHEWADGLFLYGRLGNVSGKHVTLPVTWILKVDGAH